MNSHPEINKHDDLAGERSATSQGRTHREAPYWFSPLARERHQDLRIGDYVRVRGLENQYELLDIFPRFGSVRVRAVGERECLGFPWRFIEPLEKPVIKSRTMMQAMGDVLFTGNRVYRLSEPDRVLRVREIHWDRDASDLEDEQGRVYREVSWDDMEFWDPVEFHLPEDE